MNIHNVCFHERKYQHLSRAILSDKTLCRLIRAFSALHMMNSKHTLTYKKGPCALSEMQRPDQSAHL